MNKYSKNDLRNIFQSPFNKEAWKAILVNLFKVDKIRREPEKFTSEEDNELGFYMGATETADAYRIGLFYYKIKSGSVAHKKVGLRNLVKRFINQNWGEFDAAIVVFDSGEEWRLSFVCDIKEVATTPKRFTFVFGEHDNFYRTPVERFMALQSQDATFDNIRKAFSVEALSDDFFNGYRDMYADFVQYITGKRYVKEGGKWVERELGNPDFQYADTFGKDDKLVRDYIKKMFGRIVFLYFLQRKGWLNGNRNYMRDLYANSDKKDNFLDGVLEPLFFEILNTDKPFRTEAANGLPGSNDIPYLNGGLFARDEIDERTCVFPEEYFGRLFCFLDSYNFTIDENDTEDAEIGIDPEMLGRIFENLLEDNKDKGAFYTPKEIVSYMCSESIIAYLQDKRATTEGNELIRKFVETFDDSLLSFEQRKYVKDKLKVLKICDPAIGSGAFPMGLVNILAKLYTALKLSTDASVIKRHIMEQNIYGVDIEKGAVDIARLRFWLAMIVEAKDPMPLPNLHFKIMQGNSLLESYQGIDLSDLTKTKAQRGLFDSEDAERESLVADLQHYYNTSDHTERDRLFNQIINNVRRQLFAKQITFPQGFDPSENSEFFLWHTWFADVFQNGGFDIVIGNPPYIQLQKSLGYTAIDKKGKEYDVKLGDLYKDAKFATFEKTGDIYCLFYELGNKMLKPGGHLCFITSNKWMRAGYGQSIRGYFSKKTNPKTLIDFGGIQIFDSATVDTNILLFEHAENAHATVAVTAAKHDKSILNNLSDFVRQNAADTSFDTSDSWVILTPIEQSIKRKIESVGVPLKDWDIQINYGIKTGFNDAFIISTEKRDEILANCADDAERERTAELIRPILRGRDIKRYGYDWAGLYLIATFPSRHYDIEQYPAVKAHLLSFGMERLEQTGKESIVNGQKVKARKKTNNKWFETQDSISYWDDFSKPKIAWGNLNLNASFSFVEDAFFLNAPCPMIVPGTPYLLKMLNSNIVDYCIRNLGVTRNGGYFEYKPMFVSQALIPLEESLPTDLFARIIGETNHDTINSLIAKVFSLSDEEYEFVNSKLKSK